MEREDDAFDYKLMKKELKQQMKEQKQQIKESNKMMKQQMKQDAKQLKQELKYNQRNMLNGQEQYIQSQQNFQYQMMQNQFQLQQQLQFNQQQMNMRTIYPDSQQYPYQMYQSQQNTFQDLQNMQNRQFANINQQCQQQFNNNRMNDNNNQNFQPTFQQNIMGIQNQTNQKQKKPEFKFNKRQNNLQNVLFNTQQLFEEIFDNDKQKVQQCIQNQDELAARLRKDKNSCLKQLYKVQYEKQIDYLNQNGFGQYQKIIVMLKEENGNEEIILRRLIKDNMKKELLKQIYDKEINIILKDYQLKRCKQYILKYLNETDGDIEKAVQLINLNKQTSLNDKSNYKQQLQTLALEGWLNSATYKKIIKVLKKNNGDVDKSRFEIQLICHHKVKQITYSELQSLNNQNMTEHFDEKFTDIVIDGNNLLFMNQSIRKNCINKQRAIAEKKIFQLSSHLREILGLKQLILIFDQMHTKITDNKVQVINCKQTQFNSSDDFIVNHVECLKEEQVRSSLIITSDNELTYRLFSINQNISVMKGKVFFEQIEQLLSQQIFQDIVTNDQI